MSRALEEHHWRHIQVNHPPCGVKTAPAFRIEDGTATGCHHDIVVGTQFGDRLRLSPAKPLFALDLENGRDRHPRSLDDLMIRVIENSSQSPCQLTPHSRLAGPHQADQIDIRTIIHTPILSEPGAKPKKKPASPAFSGRCRIQSQSKRTRSEMTRGVMKIRSSRRLPTSDL